MDYLYLLLILVGFITFAVFAVKGRALFVLALFCGLWLSAIAILAGDYTIDQFITNLSEVPLSQGGTIMYMFFGSWFGMMLTESGVAQSLIRKTVELGGDKPVITNVLLCIVTCVIFTSCFGAGAVMAIGVIVLPILTSLGVPKNVALSSFIIAVGAGMYINPTINAQIIVTNLQTRGIEDQFNQDLLRQNGLIALAVHMTVLIIMIVVLNKRAEKKNRTVKMWAAPAVTNQDNEEKMTPLISFLSPLVPILSIMILGVDPIVAFMMAVVYLLITCGKIKSFDDFERMMTRSFSEGVKGLAPVLGFLLISGIMGRGSMACGGVIDRTLGGIFPTSNFVMLLVLICLVPFALFRGPGTYGGSGGILISAFIALGFAPQYILTAFFFTGISMMISACVTQSWSVWGMGYSGVSTKEFLITGVPWCAVISVINLIILYITRCL